MIEGEKKEKGNKEREKRRWKKRGECKKEKEERRVMNGGEENERCIRREKGEG
jgi:hypothetical protein